MSDESKTEEPTEKRLRESWEEGRFAKAPDLQTVAVLAAAMTTLGYTGRQAIETVCGLSVTLFGHLNRYEITAEGIPDWVNLAAKMMLGLIMPMALTCAGAGMLAGGLQSRFRLSPKALGFKFERLNPMAGFGRMFSVQSWVKLACDLGKMIFIGVFVWSAVKAMLTDPIFYTPVPVDRLASFLRDTATTLIGRTVLTLGAIGGLTYVYQLKKTHSELMMTHEEIKEENKQSEGNPKVKAHLRQMARRLLQKQMLTSVATADVIITNPTHYAIALKYERGADKAPVLLAKGEGAFAKRIKALAAEHEVPMVENKPVARMLFKHGKVGKIIPSELYQAVADILAFVYRTHRYYFHQLKQRRAAHEG